jgi:hypothetical protein
MKLSNTVALVLLTIIITSTLANIIRFKNKIGKVNGQKKTLYFGPTALNIKHKLKNTDVHLYSEVNSLIFEEYKVTLTIGSDDQPPKKVELKYRRLDSSILEDLNIFGKMNADSDIRLCFNNQKLCYKRDGILKKDQIDILLPYDSIAHINFQAKLAKKKKITWHVQYHLKPNVESLYNWVKEDLVHKKDPDLVQTFIMNINAGSPKVLIYPLPTSKAS